MKPAFVKAKSLTPREKTPIKFAKSYSKQKIIIHSKWQKLSQPMKVDSNDNFKYLPFNLRISQSSFLFKSCSAVWSVFFLPFGISTNVTKKMMKFSIKNISLIISANISTNPLKYKLMALNYSPMGFVKIAFVTADLNLISCTLKLQLLNF